MDPVCQRLRADPVDQQVVGAFFEALAPAELDLYEHAREQRRRQQVEVDRAQHYTLQRLEHAAEQARRRYEAVDPAYRLVAAELEQRWRPYKPYTRRGSSMRVSRAAPKQERVTFLWSCARPSERWGKRPHAVVAGHVQSCPTQGPAAV